MESPELVTFQKYAAQHHISIHSVIKKTMNGELKTVVCEENGKEVTYIALPSSSEAKQMATDTPTGDTVEIDYKKEYEALHKEYLILKTKYEKLLGI